MLVDDLFVEPREIEELVDKSFEIVECDVFNIKDSKGKDWPKLRLRVQLSNKKLRYWLPNAKSKASLARMFGDETDNWKGKKAMWKIVEMNVWGNTKSVILVK